MIRAKYDSIVRYLNTGQPPKDFTSTLSNFRREASNYTLGAQNVLKREGKIVVRCSERESVYLSMNTTHCGRGIYYSYFGSRKHLRYYVG